VGLIVGGLLGIPCAEGLISAPRMWLLQVTGAHKAQILAAMNLFEYIFVGGMPTPLAGQILPIRWCYCELPRLSDSSINHTTSDNN
jgi:hypothetical protein